MKTNKPVTIPVETVGQVYLEVLRVRGIKYFFGNSGTDFTTGGPELQGGIQRGQLGRRNRANAISDAFRVYGDNLVDLDQ